MSRPPAVRPSAMNRRAFLRDTSRLALGAAAGVMAWPRQGVAADRDVLHIRTYTDLTTLDPAMLVSGSEALVANAVNLRLVRFRPGTDWDWQLDAAEHFEQIDDSRYEFRLQPGLRFSDGYGDVTAEDVKHSLERVIDPALHAPNVGDLGTFSHVEVSGRYAGTIVLESPFAAFVPIGLCGATGCILSARALEAAGGRFGIRPPCASGPYRLVSWQSRRKTVLARNPDWTGPPGVFREIHVYPMSDIKAGTLAYEAGELDCTQTAIENVEVFRRRLPPDSRLDVMNSLRYYWVGLNQEHPALSDLRVRRAVQFGIDVQAVIEAAWFGLATPATGIIAPGLVGHRARADIPLPGDRERARALLAEAGVELPLRLTLDVNTNRADLTAAQVVQWSLSKVGIEVTLRPQDNATFLTLGHESAGDRWRDVQLVLNAYAMLGDPYYATEWFVGEQVGIWNWERFRSEEFDRLHARALGETDPARRDPLYQRMQHLMEASGCYRFLAHGVEALLSRLWLDPVYRADGYPIYRDFGHGAGEADRVT